MKDCNGKKIIAGIKLKCINDVAYGEIYKVEHWCDVYPNLCIRDENNDVLLLSEFEQENGCLVDFKVII